MYPERHLSEEYRFVLLTGLTSCKGVLLHWPKSLYQMSPSELSSLKWEPDGEMSPQDTFNLVKKLSKVEEEGKASNLLHLSSKHSHSKAKTSNKNNHNN